MESKGKIEKIYLDSNLDTVKIVERGGAIIIYSENEVAYELKYHYLFNKLIGITQKSKKSKKIYNFLQILLAKIEALLLFDKTYYYDYKKEDLMLVNLYNNMSIY